jgi:hypothetical protein
LFAQVLHGGSWHGAAALCTQAEEYQSMNFALVAYWYLALAVLIARGTACEAAPPQAADGAPSANSSAGDWFSDREKQWGAILRRAAQPSNGLLLVVRPSGGPPRIGKPIDLIVTVQNVSNRPVSIALTRGDIPLALVRDDAGRPVERTAEGDRRYGPSWWLAFAAPSRRIRILQPGQAYTSVLPLTRYYALTSPGSYTVLVADDAMAGLVAKPFLLRIAARSEETAP